MSFNTLGLQDSLLRAIEDTGYTQPTPIQAQAIPAILSGKDVMAAAQTGTGKTAGFTLPLLQLLGKGTKARSNQARALVLTPTRELAAQIQESIETYGTHESLRSVVVFGGVKINPQLMNMRKGADILVATPGRLLDLYQQKAVKFSDLEVLVLDEADRMLDMGFIRDIRRILPLLPKQRQNLMFSATFSDDIRQLAKTICNQPVEIDVAPRNSTVETITQLVYQVRKEDKVALLSTLLRTKAEQTLVFSRTKHGANKLVKCLMRDGVNAAAIHGNKSQNQRTKALDDFKQNRVQVLVATDIAARGIDIDDLAQVINFDLPNVSEDYVHRIGRTGRAGASGVAISLVSNDENGLLRDIERLIKRKIDRADLPEFTKFEGELPDFEDRPKRQHSRGRTGQARDSRSPRTSNNGGNNSGNANSNNAGNGGQNKPRRSRRPAGQQLSQANRDNRPERDGNTAESRTEGNSNMTVRSSRSGSNRSRNARTSTNGGNASRSATQGRGNSQGRTARYPSESNANGEHSPEHHRNAQRNGNTTSADSGSSANGNSRKGRGNGGGRSGNSQNGNSQNGNSKSSTTTMNKIKRFFSGGPRAA